MEAERIIDLISRGRTDFVFELLRLPDWREHLERGAVRPLQWLVYHNDVTAMRAVLEAGGTLASLDLDRELGNAAFTGSWKMVDFLLARGADPRFADPATGETALHSALAKAGRPYYLYTVRLLAENGADVNAKTVPDVETGAFMRDVRTKGETPLHRAAAYSDAETIRYLISKGARTDARDARGDSPLTWASEHLRPGEILGLLEFDGFRISERSRKLMIADHGAGWGYGMEWNTLGEFVAESASEEE
jgi:hypothetical protein